MLAQVDLPRRIVFEVTHKTLLEIAQPLPTVPASFDASLGDLKAKQRSATPAEMDSLRWFVAFDGARVVGLAATHDRYDWPTLCDVRELVHIVGTKRGVADVFRWVRALSEADGRPMIGSIVPDNTPMRHFLEHLDATFEREIYSLGLR